MRPVTYKPHYIREDTPPKTDDTSDSSSDNDTSENYQRHTQPLRLSRRFSKRMFGGNSNRQGDRANSGLTVQYGNQRGRMYNLRRNRGMRFQRRGQFRGIGARNMGQFYKDSDGNEMYVLDTPSYRKSRNMCEQQAQMSKIGQSKDKKETEQQKDKKGKEQQNDKKEIEPEKDKKEKELGKDKKEKEPDKGKTEKQTKKDKKEKEPEKDKKEKEPENDKKEKELEKDKKEKEPEKVEQTNILGVKGTCQNTVASCQNAGASDLASKIESFVRSQRLESENLLSRESSTLPSTRYNQDSYEITGKQTNESEEPNETRTIKIVPLPDSIRLPVPRAAQEVRQNEVTVQAADSSGIQSPVVQEADSTSKTETKSSLANVIGGSIKKPTVISRVKESARKGEKKVVHGQVKDLASSASSTKVCDLYDPSYPTPQHPDSIKLIQAYDSLSDSETNDQRCIEDIANNEKTGKPTFTPAASELDAPSEVTKSKSTVLTTCEVISSASKNHLETKKSQGHGASKLKVRASTSRADIGKSKEPDAHKCHVKSFVSRVYSEKRKSKEFDSKKYHSKSSSSRDGHHTSKRPGSSTERRYTYDSKRPHGHNKHYIHKSQYDYSKKYREMSLKRYDKSYHLYKERKKLYSKSDHYSHSKHSRHSSSLSRFPRDKGNRRSPFRLITRAPSDSYRKQRKLQNEEHEKGKQPRKDEKSFSKVKDNIYYVGMRNLKSNAKKTKSVKETTDKE